MQKWCPDKSCARWGEESPALTGHPPCSLRSPGSPPPPTTQWPDHPSRHVSGGCPKPPASLTPAGCSDICSQCSRENWPELLLQSYMNTSYWRASQISDQDRASRSSSVGSSPVLQAGCAMTSGKKACGCWVWTRQGWSFCCQR